MLESCLFESRPDSDRIGSRKKPATLAMSVLVHVLIAGALILIPLLQTQAVPPVTLPPPVVRPGAPVRIIKLAATPSSGHAAPRPVAPVQSDTITAPQAIPDRIAYVVDAIDIGAMDALRPGYSTNSDGPFAAGPLGIPNAIAPPTAAAPPQPPPTLPTPPPAPKFQTREPIRVASSLQTSRLIRQVDPVYPHLAVVAHVEGAVILEARITQVGTVDSIRIISGHPLLIQSVIEAVKQWRYQPTLLNGDPVEVITTVTVNFTMK